MLGQGERRASNGDKYRKNISNTSHPAIKHEPYIYSNAMVQF